MRECNNKHHEFKLKTASWLYTTSSNKVHSYFTNYKIEIRNNLSQTNGEYKMTGTH